MDKFKPNHREITDWIGNQRITWCGPYSVATVAGTSYERAYQTLKLIRGKRHCKGVSNANIASACKKLGIKGKWKKLEKRTKLESRVTILGHVQRGGTPSAADRLLATRLGATTAEVINEGRFGVMIAARGEAAVPVPLEEIVGKRKTVPLDHPWIRSARSIGTSLGD